MFISEQMCLIARNFRRMVAIGSELRMESMVFPENPQTNKFQHLSFWILTHCCPIRPHFRSSDCDTSETMPILKGLVTMRLFHTPPQNIPGLLSVQFSSLANVLFPEKGIRWRDFSRKKTATKSFRGFTISPRHRNLWSKVHSHIAVSKRFYWIIPISCLIVMFVKWGKKIKI